eukprot:COSAG06_NODE_6964_length_2694_cov_3.747206_2_plen_64_part_00
MVGARVLSRPGRVLRLRVWNTSSLVILTAHYINTYFVLYRYQGRPLYVLYGCARTAEPRAPPF